MSSTPTANISPAPSRHPDHAHRPSPPQQGPSKRPRTSSNMAPERASSTSDASSQSGETEPEQTHPSAPQPAPPKKKRTRTLTTPHQSAVLHALLAKVPFPFFSAPSPLTFFLVPVPHHSHARRGRSTNRLERPQSTGGSDHGYTTPFTMLMSPLDLVPSASLPCSFECVPNAAFRISGKRRGVPSLIPPP